MTHTTFTIKQNDTSPALRVNLKDGDGAAVSVASATVTFSMAAGGVAKVTDGTVTTVDGASGVVEYPWQTGDTDTAGNFYAEFEVEFTDGTFQTFPNSQANQLNVIIEPEIA